MNPVFFRRLFPLVVIPLSILLLSVEAWAEKKIGILLWTEEPRYIELKNGILDQLKKDGFGKPEVTYIIENATGSKIMLLEAVNKFAALKIDLIFTLGTSATIPAAKTIHDVPIVFSMVYDPIVTGIAKSWKSSGNNTTGTSSRLPSSTIVSKLLEFTPVKRLAVLYTPREKNSETQLVELQKIQKSFQLEVVPVILTRDEEIAQVLPVVVQTVDALYLTGSSIVGAAIPEIVDIANKAHVVTITHLDDVVENGALLGICLNSYELGRLAGKKAVQILNGATPSSIPIEPGKSIGVILNKKTAQAGQFQIPPAFMKKVTRIIE